VSCHGALPYARADGFRMGTARGSLVERGAGSAKRNAEAVRRAAPAHRTRWRTIRLGDLLFDRIVAARQCTRLTAYDYDEVWSLIKPFGSQGSAGGPANGNGWRGSIRRPRGAPKGFPSCWRPVAAACAMPQILFAIRRGVGRIGRVP